MNRIMMDRVMLALAVTVVLAISYQPVSAVTGKVIDADTKEALSEVTVTHKGTANQVTSDASGSFTITVSTTSISTLAPVLAIQPTYEQMTIYDMRGSKLAGGYKDDLPGLRLADGVYLARIGGKYVRIIKAGNCFLKDSWQLAVGKKQQTVESRHKAAAGITLVFIKNGYKDKEMAVASADADITVEMEKQSTWPDDTNTGPIGTLKQSGPVTVTTPGAVIENLDVDGEITIKADNVTVRNCRFFICRNKANIGAVIEDCEGAWVGNSNFTLRRTKLSQASDDLVRVSGPNVTIEDCFLYITGPEKAGTHCDVIQEYPVGTGKNFVVRHNTLWNANPQTSIVISATDMLFENNLAAGGGYTLYSNSGQRIINNRFSTRFWPKCGYWGVKTGNPGQWTGNVWHETGVQIPK